MKLWNIYDCAVETDQARQPMNSDEYTVQIQVEVCMRSETIQSRFSLSKSI